MPIDFTQLTAYGWSNHFQSQLEADELADGLPARVLAVHRNRLEVGAPSFEDSVPPFSAGEEEEDVATVGDWLLLDGGSLQPRRLLERKSLFKRKAAGLAQRVQPIAANVDTLFIVSSCNEEFNVARLERYISLARQAGVVPIVVLTKADLADDPVRYVSEALKVRPGMIVATVDARDAGSIAALRTWCGVGQTIALVGSSGVGKSTLVNSLLGQSIQSTSGIREQDAHGRHTTTGRSLHRLGTGGWLLDTPGMRELQLTDAQAGIEDVFSDVVSLASSCRFADCRHENEPDCAVQAAIAAGSLDPERLRRYRKLAAEDARNSEAIHERRSRARSFGRMAKRIMADKEDRWRR